MLKVDLIGNLGADAELKEANASKFLSMRIAHTERHKDAQGQTIDKTVWVDVTLSNTDSNIVPYLKAGVKVFVRGYASLRVYSSQKDRCMKAGLTVMAQEIELCGGSSDSVPKQLIVPDTGAIVPVTKFYQADIDTTEWIDDDIGYLVDTKGNQFMIVKGGWVRPVVTQAENKNA